MMITNITDKFRVLSGMALVDKEGEVVHAVLWDGNYYAQETKKLIRAQDYLLAISPTVIDGKLCYDYKGAAEAYEILMEEKAEAEYAKLLLKWKLYSEFLGIGVQDLSEMSRDCKDVGVELRELLYDLLGDCPF